MENRKKRVVTIALLLNLAPYASAAQVGQRQSLTPRTAQEEQAQLAQVLAISLQDPALLAQAASLETFRQEESKRKAADQKRAQEAADRKSREDKRRREEAERLSQETIRRLLATEEARISREEENRLSLEAIRAIEATDRAAQEKRAKEEDEWVQTYTKPCPKCNARIEKIDGCLYVTCKCGHSFCYKCYGTHHVHLADCHNPEVGNPRFKGKY